MTHKFLKQRQILDYRSRGDLIPDYSQIRKVSLNDGAVDVFAMVSDAFPGYIDDAEFPFYPVNALTHPAYDEVVNVGHFSLGDSPENFERKLAELGPDWYYASKEITYEVNSNGYRTHEWADVDWSECIVLVGCSMTFGTGVAQDETISHYLSQITGRQVVNLGVPAASNEMILNNAMTVFSKFGNPYAMVANWTTLDRFTFYSDTVLSAGLWSDNEVVDGVNMSQLYKLNNYNQTHMQIRSYNIARSLKIMAEPRTKYISVSYFPDAAKFTRSTAWIKIDRGARDCIHAGRKNHRTCAEYIKAQLS